MYGSGLRTGSKSVQAFLSLATGSWYINGTGGADVIEATKPRPAYLVCRRKRPPTTAAVSTTASASTPTAAPTLPAGAARPVGEASSTRASAAAATTSGPRQGPTITLVFPGLRWRDVEGDASLAKQLRDAVLAFLKDKAGLSAGTLFSVSARATSDISDGSISGDGGGTTFAIAFTASALADDGSDAAERAAKQIEALPDDAKVLVYGGGKTASLTTASFTAAKAGSKVAALATPAGTRTVSLVLALDYDSADFPRLTAVVKAALVAAGVPDVAMATAVITFRRGSVIADVTVDDAAAALIELNSAAITKGILATCSDSRSCSPVAEGGGIITTTATAGQTTRGGGGGGGLDQGLDADASDAGDDGGITSNDPLVFGAVAAVLLLVFIVVVSVLIGCGSAKDGKDKGRYKGECLRGPVAAPDAYSCGGGSRGYPSCDGVILVAVVVNALARARACVCVRRGGQTRDSARATEKDRTTSHPRTCGHHPVCHPCTVGARRPRDRAGVRE